MMRRPAATTYRTAAEVTTSRIWDIMTGYPSSRA
jgi:hypothetical protein